MQKFKAALVGILTMTVIPLVFGAVGWGIGWTLSYLPGMAEFYLTPLATILGLVRGIFSEAWE